MLCRAVGPARWPDRLSSPVRVVAVRTGPVRARPFYVWFGRFGFGSGLVPVLVVSVSAVRVCAVQVLLCGSPVQFTTDSCSAVPVRFVAFMLIALSVNKWHYRLINAID